MPALRTRDTQHQRSLEVSTEAPSVPTLSIVSPTPRAWTFPQIPHFSDSPYSSPSHSPFQPDLHPLSIISPTTPTLNISRTLSPIYSPTSGSPSPTHIRRKSSISSDVDRRPKRGDEDYIKRPENAFILFRRQCCEDRQAAEAATDAPTKKQRQADLSKSISQRWKSLPKDEKQVWEDLAKEKKREHAELYPGYVYRPQRGKDKDGRPKPRKPRSPNKKSLAAHDSDFEAAELSFAIPVHTDHRQHGRSLSDPSPPITHQIVRVPNLYMNQSSSPSCPTSPSLLPMLQRRGSYQPDSMTHFDYVPPSLMPVTFGQYESGIHQTPYYPAIMVAQEPSLPALSSHTTLLPAHELISPCGSIASGSSAPPSPMNGPYTPCDRTQPFLHPPPPFDLMYPGSEHGCESSQETPPDLDLHWQYQAYNWENNSVWQNGTGPLDASDFDLGLIPVAQFEEIKGNEQLDLTLLPVESSDGFSMSQYLNETASYDSLLQYDEMMANLP